MISKHGFLQMIALALHIACHSLTLSLRLSHTKFLSYEAVLNHLVYIFFFRKWALVVEVHIPHLLTDIGLVNVLRVVANEAVVSKVLANKIAVDSIGVRGGGPLLMATWLDLIFTEKNALAMYLLEGDVRR